MKYTEEKFEELFFKLPLKQRLLLILSLTIHLKFRIVSALIFPVFCLFLPLAKLSDNAGSGILLLLCYFLLHFFGKYLLETWTVKFRKENPAIIRVFKNDSNYGALYNMGIRYFLFYYVIMAFPISLILWLMFR